MNQAPDSIVRSFLQAAVIICAAFFLFMKWTNPSGDQYGGEASEVPNANYTARNEQSTPRSFVLPATPGIAFQQEREEAERADQGQIAKCVERLKDLGYGVEDSRPILNPEVIEAVYKFQVEQRLPPTGHFDPATMRTLGC